MNKKLISLILAIVMVFALATTALADGPIDTSDGSTTTHASDDGVTSVSGGTTVGVVTYKEGAAAGSVSFSVPLYATMAVVGTEGGGGEVYGPASSNYKIVNTNGANDNYIGVSTIKIRRTSASAWTITTGTPSGGTAMKLTVGNAEAPALVASNTSFVNFDSTKLAASSFRENNKMKVIGGDTDAKKELGIVLDGTVATNWKSAIAQDTTAAPQWQIEYTLTKCDATGEAKLGSFVYAGNTPVYVWDATNGFTTAGAFATAPAGN